MAKHAFRIAMEKGAGAEELASLFVPEIELYAPMLTKPVKGIEQVLNIVTLLPKIASHIKYTLEVNDPEQTILLWKGKVEDFPLEAATILVDGEDGRIREMRMLMRSWPMVTLFRDAMYRELSLRVPKDCWEVGPKLASIDQRNFTPIALKTVDMALDVELHSPILAKPVKGKVAVEAALNMAHSIQSASSYTSVIATPNLLVELFDCDAAGYPMEGLWISKLNAHGQIYDLTVYLRPYPTVTALRNKAKELAAKTKEFAFLTPDYWELAKSA